MARCQPCLNPFHWSLSLSLSNYLPSSPPSSPLFTILSPHMLFLCVHLVILTSSYPSSLLRSLGWFDPFVKPPLPVFWWPRPAPSVTVDRRRAATKSWPLIWAQISGNTSFERSTDSPISPSRKPPDASPTGCWVCFKMIEKSDTWLWISVDGVESVQIINLDVAEWV